MMNAEKESNMPTWMIVEDEPDIYDALLTLFEIWGIEGVAFVNGEEALDWIDDVDQGRFVGELPKLALVDIRLPGGIDGLAVGAQLRQSPILRSMSIVLTTAYRLTPEQEARAIEQAGADRLIYKPYHHLRRQLEEVLAQRRAITRTRTSDLGTHQPGAQPPADHAGLDAGADR